MQSYYHYQMIHFLFLSFISELQNSSYLNSHLHFKSAKIFLIRAQLQTLKLCHLIIFSLHQSFKIFLFISKLIHFAKHLNFYLFQSIYWLQYSTSIYYFYKETLSYYLSYNSLHLAFVYLYHIGFYFYLLSFVIQILKQISSTILRSFDFLMNIYISFELNSMILLASFSNFSNPLYVFIFK